MNKGDIILLPFPFTDLSGGKIRPAVILIVSEDDITVCFLTTQLKLFSEFDISIEPSEMNGLKKTSMIKTNKLATIDKELIIGRIGILEDHYIDMLNQNLLRILKLQK
jgi:mRNA interferase MazF